MHAVLSISAPHVRFLGRPPLQIPVIPESGHYSMHEADRNQHGVGKLTGLFRLFEQTLLARIRRFDDCCDAANISALSRGTRRESLGWCKLVPLGGRICERPWRIRKNRGVVLLVAKSRSSRNLGGAMDSTRTRSGRQLKYETLTLPRQSKCLIRHVPSAPNNRQMPTNQSTRTSWS